MFFQRLGAEDRKSLVGHCTSVLGLEGGDHDLMSDDPIMALPPKVYRWLDRYITDHPSTTLQDILQLERA
jgi:hypothetical protein